MAPKIIEKDGVKWEEVKISTDIIDIDGMPLFEEISLQNNPLLTEEDLNFIITQKRQKIAGKVGMAFFLDRTSDELLAQLIIKMPKLKRCIIRIGPDKIWLPLPVFVYFKGDPRLN